MRDRQATRDVSQPQVIWQVEEVVKEVYVEREEFEEVIQEVYVDKVVEKVSCLPTLHICRRRHNTRLGLSKQPHSAQLDPSVMTLIRLPWRGHLGSWLR